MSNQETIKDLIFMLPYVVMFFIYLLFTLVVSGIVITIGYFISIKKLKINTHLRKVRNNKKL